MIRGLLHGELINRDRDKRGAEGVWVINDDDDGK